VAAAGMLAKAVVERVVTAMELTCAAVAVPLSRIAEGGGRT